MAKSCQPLKLSIKCNTEFNSYQNWTIVIQPHCEIKLTSTEIFKIIHNVQNNEKHTPYVR